MTVILDISRLISRVRYSTPSGVDRVEMAYARGLYSQYGSELAFAAVHPSGYYGRLRADAALAYLDALETRWRNEQDAPRQRSLAAVLPQLAKLLPTRKGIGSIADGRAVYVQASPHHLTNQTKVARILARERARFLCLVHDLIPIEFPEYARVSGAALHRRRIETIASVIAGTRGAAIVNSAATGRALTPWLEPGTPVHVALLGTEALPAAAPEIAAEGRPYFVCLGTIEPRKNHLLLLNIWRHMAEVLAAHSIPRLVIVGRRGWENEQIVDMLDRCPALVGHVKELSSCPDARLSSLLRGARALLMPSFAEGYGMPVAEALAVGTPVIASDLAALREVGGPVPDYLSPLDGSGWLAAIRDHAACGPRYIAQMARLPQWQAPSWSDHIAVVTGAITALSQLQAGERRTGASG